MDTRAEGFNCVVATTSRSNNIYMGQNYWHGNPSTFAETVQLVQSYVKEEVVRETKNKQLYYHTLDHALAVQRRAERIFQEIQFELSQDKSGKKLERLRSLTSLCGLAHDMVQLFHPPARVNSPRRHISELSERETANKLIQYIQKLNRELATYKIEPSSLFDNSDLQIIQDAIVATICKLDPLSGQGNYSFSSHSIYQPYLYDSQPKISVIGSIIALADLGTLGMEGIDKYIHDGILIFLEDNLDLKELILYGDRSNINGKMVRPRLLAMARFMVSFARERYARFEPEISVFAPAIRQIFRDQIFVYLNLDNIAAIEEIVPTQEDTSLPKLIDFFRLDKNYS
jgi:hypothetical protein